MGILSSLFSTKHSQTKDPVVDLRTFICGHTKLGTEPDPRDVFTPHLKTRDVYTSPSKGCEVGTKERNLDYVFITIATYKGQFSNGGANIELDKATTPSRIISEFGEPYWTDTKDGETILFYELEGGMIELQFEFPDNKTLSFITLAQEGVLSNAEQRRLYGVTKSWPPAPSSARQK
jgi:hypothetical protein